MDEFTSVERSIARFLSRFPFVKKMVKKLFIQFSFYLNKKNEIIFANSPVEALIPVENSFFGYYDKCPESENGQVLVHSTCQDTSKLPDPEKPIDVILLSSDKEELLRVSTRAYNWQQGARLQWLTDDLFAFNDFVDGAYVTRMFSAEKQSQVDQFPLAIQDGWKDKFFLSVNYERLNVLRPDYGYRNKSPLGALDIKNMEHDGIWFYDMVSRESKLIISLAKLAAAVDENEAIHKVNHISICPNGNHFVFLHRYLINDRRFDRLIVSSFDGKDLRLLADFGMVSHYCWLNSSELIGFLRGPDGDDGYWKINLITNEFSKLDVCQGLGDGHPSFNGSLIVTDTYPNKSRMQKLVLFNRESLQQQVLGSFFHPIKFSSESRCDLHPRFSKDGRYVYFDSIYDGYRRLYRIRVDNHFC